MFNKDVQDQVQVYQVSIILGGPGYQDGSSRCFGTSWLKVLVAN